MIKKTIGFTVFLLLYGAQLLAQCTGIDFYTNTPNGCVPHLAKFTATGFPSGSEFSWDFGTGYSSQSSSDSSKVNVFTIAGFYTIKLKVFLPLGGTCVITKNNYVTVGNKPVPVFTVNNTLICNGADTITFTDNTPKSMSRDWIIDGVVYNNGPAVIKHFFNFSGYKSVTLIVRDSLGCQGITSKDSVVRVVSKPTIDFTASSVAGCNPRNVTFTPNVTNLGTQSIVSYIWTMTGSNTPISNAVTPSVVYANPGLYSVTLNVITDVGCNYSFTRTNYISVGATVVISFQANNTSVCRNQLVRLVNTTVGMPLPGQFTWTLNGASLVQGTLNSDTVFVKYPTIGTYDVQLDYNYNSCISTKSQTNYITVNPPVASFFSPDQRNCFVPDTVNFTSTSTLPATGVNSYAWTVYDLNKVTVLFTSTAQNPTFIIPKFGRFDVRLVVSNTNGCADTVRVTDYIVVDTAAADFNASPQVACMGQRIDFGDNTPPFSNKAPKKFRWTFYDLDKVTILKTDTVPAPIMYYYNLGKYNVKLEVYNAFGCGDTLLKDSFITIGLPKAGFTVTDSNICAGASITFKENTTPVITTMVHSWTIKHKDSTNIVINSGPISGSGAQFAATFNTPGIYHVTYRGINGIFCADSITRSNYIQVSGIKGSISANKLTACPGTTLNFTSAILYNLHYVNPSNTITYEWTCTPAGNGASATGFSIANNTAGSTGIAFTVRGTYKINCKFKNSEGCTSLDPANEITVNIGAYAGFYAYNVVCLYDTLSPTNLSALNPVGFKWYSDASVGFSPYDTSTSPKVKFSTTGYHTLNLVATTADGCKDTATFTVFVTKPKADFASDDTENICGPVLVRMKSNSIGAVQFDWDFGDGSPRLVTTDSSVAHIFAIKNGKSTFDIQLVVTDMYGCRDTVTKTAYIRIVGPVPYFKLYNNKGCEPLTVHIVDSSRYVSKFYFNYGFGPIDSTAIGDKTYYLASATAPFTVYHPSLFVYDNSGTCFQFYQPADSIVVYRNPQAGFYVNDSTDCAPFGVQFVDTSKGAVKWKWDYENDGITDDTIQNPIHVFGTAGKYTVKLIVTNIYGCTDTLIKPDFIESYQIPDAQFAVLDTAICPGGTVRITNLTTSAVPVSKYHWDFGDPSTLADTSDAAAPLPYTYKNPGTYSVKLIVTDSLGCMDSLQMLNKIKVFDSLPPSQPQIYCVTVVNDAEIRIVWSKNTAADFVSYTVHRNNGAGMLPLFTKNAVNDTTHLDNNAINVKTQSYAYTVDAIDNCNYLSAKSTVHASIYLDATTQNQNTTLITWTGYKGWAPGTFGYKLYRAYTYAGPYVLYAQLTDADTSYIDANLCDSDYYYYVDAVQPGTGFISRSNIDFNHPPFYLPNDMLVLTNATVVNDKDILITWDTTGKVNTNKKLYLVDRYEGSFMNIGSTTTGSFLDTKADVHAASYSYRIRMKDYCGNVNPGSNIGKSILLKAGNTNYVVNLTWTPYQDWSNGVAAYLVEYKDPKTYLFSTIGVVAGNVTSYDDKEFHNGDTAFCYRVRAIENDPIKADTSVSNEACVFLPPVIYIPNAFTPNKDGVNDIFYAQGVFIQNLTGKPLIDYELKIYDRWGQLIFETNDLTRGWDGNINSQPAEEGVYVYEMRATGFNRQRFNYKGTFHLLR